MIGQSKPMELVHPKLADSEGKLSVYTRKNYGFVADDGHRWGVIICPGGGYGMVSPSEGEPVALAYLAAGMQAFVLEYSVAPARYPRALLELAASVAWVRSNGEAFGIDRVAVCGFSAGGHLAGSLCNLWNHPVLSPLGFTKAPEVMRPDAGILCYPVVTARGGPGHMGSFENLLGTSEPIPPELSLERSVTVQNPPAFLWATATDGTVSVENTLLYASSLRQAEVPFEVHIFSDGPHAMGLATPESAWSREYENPHAAHWHELSVEWLRRLA